MAYRKLDLVDVEDRTIDVLLVPPCVDFDAGLAIDTLRMANFAAGRSILNINILTATNAEITMTSGRTISPTMKLDQIKQSRFIVVLSTLPPSTEIKARVIPWLRKMARQGAKILAATNGPALLAEAGLLAGRRATAHWEFLPSLIEHYPEVEFVEHIWVSSDDLVTCAGHMSIVDMLLAFIASYFGEFLALALSKELILPHWRSPDTLQRGGGTMTINGRLSQPVSKAVSIMRSNVETVLSIAHVAALTGCTHRHIEKLFKVELRKTPKAYYLEVRIEKAKDYLFYSDMSIRDISLATGFSSPATFCRAFRSVTGLTATGLRSNFTARAMRPRVNANDQPSKLASHDA